MSPVDSLNLNNDKNPRVATYNFRVVLICTGSLVFILDNSIIYLFCFLKNVLKSFQEQIIRFNVHNVLDKRKTGCFMNAYFLKITGWRTECFRPRMTWFQKPPFLGKGINRVITIA
jgi:hypothetical protein